MDRTGDCQLKGKQVISMSSKEVAFVSVLSFWLSPHRDTRPKRRKKKSSDFELDLISRI